MARNLDNIYIIDKIIRDKDIYTLYNNLIRTNCWSLDRKSLPTNQEYGTFPGFIIQENTNIFNPFWSGYFSSLFERLNHQFEKKYKFTLPSTIKRIHLVAKNDTSLTEFHCDTQDTNCYSIVGFLTPVWAKEWGGELMVEDSKIDFEPGKFVAFKSNLRHNGVGQIKKIPYWRISINYVIGD